MSLNISLQKKEIDEKFSYSKSMSENGQQHITFENGITARIKH